MELAEFIGKSDYHEQLERIYSSLPLFLSIMQSWRMLLRWYRGCGWSDVGSPATLDGVVPADEHENLVLGKAVTIDTQGCTLLAEHDHLIATIGLKDMVVHTQDHSGSSENRAQK